MAVSKPINSGYSYVMGSGSGPNGSRIEVWAEWKESNVSVANNSSSVTVKLYAAALSSSSTWSGSGDGKSWITINGSEVQYSSSLNYDFRTIGTVNSLGTRTLSGIVHNTDGSKSIVIGGRFTTASSYITGGSVSKTVALQTIPQYASVTQTLASKTETTINITWASDNTVDQIRYSSDGGSTWSSVISVNAKTGSYSISGLTAGTTYSIKTRVRNKSSQLTSDSDALSVATYSYPYCNSMPNFVLGDAVTLGFYNPLGREIQFNIIGNQNTQLAYTWTISGTTYRGLNSMTSTVPQLYQQIPNSSSGTYKVKVTYGSSVITRTGGTYSAKASDCAPTIGTFTYEDTNSTTTAITSDSSKIVQGKSIVQYTVGNITTYNGASITSVKVTVNTRTYDLTTSGSSYVGGNAAIDSGTDVTAVATVIDSRGMTATKNITVDMLPWSLPTAIISLERDNNFYSESTINVDVSYADLNGGNTTTVRYHMKKHTDTTYEAWVYIQPYVDNTLTANNQYDWDFEIEVYDRLGHTTYTRFLGKGMPLVFFDRLRSSVGINCFPDTNNALWVNGIDYTYETGTVTLSSGWQVYSTATPLIRRQGRTVYLNGVVQPTGTVTLDATGVDIGIIDDAEMRPTETVYALCQGSGTSLFFLRVYANGRIHIERLRDMANANGTYNNGTSSMWFPFSLTWII